MKTLLTLLVVMTIALLFNFGIKIHKIHKAEQVNDSLRNVLHHVLTDKWNIK